MPPDEPENTATEDATVSSSPTWTTAVDWATLSEPTQTSEQPSRASPGTLVTVTVAKMGEMAQTT